MSDCIKTTEEGLISIITPVYKAERFIRQTIAAVRAQSYQNWELLLIDDCSPDSSADIIRELQTEEKRIHYHRLPINSGAAVARNMALQMARGEFLAFLDSDDLWYPQKLERQLRFMKDKDCSFSYTGIEFVDSLGQKVKMSRSIPERTDYKLLLRQTVIATSTVMIDRRKVPPFQMPLRRSGQDYATWLQLLRQVDCALGLNECLTAYRLSGESLSANKLSSVRQVYEIQTQDEHIGRLRAVFNTLCFCLYAFRKHYL